MVQEDPNDELLGLRSALVGYSRSELAAGVGGLQLLPANADVLLRLEAFANALKGVPSGGIGRPSMHRWRQWLNGPLVSQSVLPSLEDPFDRPFTEPTSFHRPSL